MSNFPYSSSQSDFQRFLLVIGALIQESQRVSLTWHRAFVDSGLAAKIHIPQKRFNMLQSTVSVADFLKSLAASSPPPPQSEIAYLEPLLDFDEAEEIQLDLPFRDRL